MTRRLAVLAVIVAALASPLAAPPALASGDYEATAESAACGLPRFYPPRADDIGGLPGSHLVRGPAGALFGRTLADVEEQLVWWTVPMSDGARVEVHRRLLPALRAVEANLKEAAINGLHYPVRASATSGFVPRTSRAHDGISFHGLGAAIDINSDANPYRLDGELVTDMPSWFVQAWESAGMCWGGGWRFAKDPMHFSWMGPTATPGFDTVPAPLPPLTSPRSFTREAGSHQVVFGPVDDPLMVSDVSGDGGPDVVRLRPWGDAMVLEAAISQRGYAACGVWRWWLGEETPPGTPYLADTTGVGRPDLVYADYSSGNLTLHRYSVMSGYEPAADISTDVVALDGRTVAFGDIDRDGADDLWVVDDTSTGVAIQIRSATSGYDEIIAEGVVAGIHVSQEDRLATADRTVDGREDLLVVDAAGTVTVIAAGSLDTVEETLSAPPLAPSDAVGVVDYDGDGRPDLQVLSDGGSMEVWLGNSVLPGDPHSWILPSDFECPDDTLPYHHVGRFADDDASRFQADIEWLVTAGITRGCNPPFEDRFCPDDSVTRGQMAAFLVRALELASGENRFVDDNRSVFESDIGALASAGITKGCNPPANDEYCPTDPVTRGQMAAFLTRALDLAPGVNRFADDEGSVFEGDIAALAAAGITRGCNPPVNDEFCPGSPVTRGQMAAFLHRAAAWLP